MAIKLGKYSFTGPVASIDKLKDRSGVYAIVCKVDNEYFLTDVGESSKLRTRIENYCKNDCWTEDNSTGAATAGKKLEAAFKKFDKSALTTAQKKTYEDVEADANEDAEHIGANGGNIEHQREHFDLLSKDIYDLVKAFSSGQILYKDFDPMYNKGKGAFWLSETKEIKNPFIGKAMLTSGSIQEELK